MKKIKLEKLLETHEGVKALKNAAIRIHNFGLASDLRSYEKEKFPEEASKFKEEKDLANTVLKVLHMADIKVPSSQLAYVIYHTIKLFIEKEQETDIMSISKVLGKAEEIFD